MRPALQGVDEASRRQGFREGGELSGTDRRVDDVGFRLGGDSRGRAVRNTLRVRRGCADGEDGRGEG